MTSTRDNPGAFKASSPPAVRTIASRTTRLLREREYRTAAFGLLVDAINLIEARAGSAMPKHFHCSCCGYEAHAFRHIFSSGKLVWNSACPACDSRSRHRGLAVLLPRLLDEYQPRRVLHFAPEPVLRRYFERANVAYETADLHLDDATHTGIDLQRLPFRESSYDFVVCNHVLEHIPNDGAALAEIARTLSPGGVAVLTVPGDFTRAETVSFTGELPNGHYRDYGLDLIPRLKGVFTRVQALDMHLLDSKNGTLSYGIRKRDLAFVCDR